MIKREEEVFTMKQAKGKIWILVLTFTFLIGAFLPLKVEGCGYCLGVSGPRRSGYGPYCNRGAGYEGGYCPRFAYNPGKTNQTLNQDLEKDARNKAIKLYQDTYGKKEGLTAKVTDYGCHVQVDIYEKDKLVKSYTYQQGNIFGM
jgi:hypothetical protein